MYVPCFNPFNFYIIPFDNFESGSCILSLVFSHLLNCPSESDWYV